MNHSSNKLYSLNCTKGNVLNVISDRKILIHYCTTGIENNDVLYGISFSNYYALGMQLPERHESVGDSYRYGFQNQEVDPEIKGEGNSVNYKYRMHDPRLGRFFAVDPLTATYPYLTPYQFSSNSPIYMIELEGLEGKIYLYKYWLDDNNKEQSEFIKTYDAPGLLKAVNKKAWKEYDNPDGKTIEYEYSVRMPNV